MVVAQLPGALVLHETLVNPQRTRALHCAIDELNPAGHEAGVRSNGRNLNRVHRRNTSQQVIPADHRSKVLNQFVTSKEGTMHIHTAGFVVQQFLTAARSHSGRRPLTPQGSLKVAEQALRRLRRKVRVVQFAGNNLSPVSYTHLTLPRKRIV